VEGDLKEGQRSEGGVDEGLITGEEEGAGNLILERAVVREGHDLWVFDSWG